VPPVHAIKAQGKLEVLLYSLLNSTRDGVKSRHSYLLFRRDVDGEDCVAATGVVVHVVPPH